MIAEELYAKLPPETRDQLSLLDFLDLVRRAGLTDKADHDHVVLRAPDKARLKSPSCEATLSGPAPRAVEDALAH